MMPASRTGFSKRLLSAACLWSVVLCASPAVWADSQFGSTWQARPLIDTTKVDAANAAKPANPQTALKPTEPAQQASQPSEAEIALAMEKKLKPAEPFIRELEKTLSLSPQQSPTPPASNGGLSLLQRLNTLQDVVFGGPQYKDAGELLAKLADVFPKEAEKANQQIQRELSQLNAGNSRQNTNTLKALSPEADDSLANQAADFSPLQERSYPQGANNAPLQPSDQAGSKTAKPRKKWWRNANNDDPFANDPFFQDSGEYSTFNRPNNYPEGQSAPQYSQNNAPNRYTTPDDPYDYTTPDRTTAKSEQSPSRLKSLGQGLTNLAVMAGNYYLGRRAGNAYDPYYNNGYDPYGNPYGNNPYGYSPYSGYGYNPYGMGYGPYSNANYGTNSLGVSAY